MFGGTLFTEHLICCLMSSANLLLLRVAAAWPLPGLGLLVLPDAATPHLATYPLHTVLVVEAALPIGPHHAATATVEEITHAGSAERGLLLDFGPDAAPPLPPGTEIWLVQ